MCGDDAYLLFAFFFLAVDDAEIWENGEWETGVLFGRVMLDIQDGWMDGVPQSNQSNCQSINWRGR